REVEARRHRAAPAHARRCLPVAHRSRRRRGSRSRYDRSRPRSSRKERDMSVATAQSTAPSLETRIRYGFADGFVVMRRNILQISRIPTTLILELVQPVMFVLLFAFVFGGNITNL